MKHIMLFEEFSMNDVNEALNKEIEKLGEGFNDLEEIAKAVELAGFTRLPATKRTGEYVFSNPDRSVKYVSSTAGWVRYYDPSGYSWSLGQKVTTKTPVHKDRIESPKDRLLVILRLAMKASGIYTDWKKSGLTGKEFFEKNKTRFTAKSIGLI